MLKQQQSGMLVSVELISQQASSDPLSQLPQPALAKVSCGRGCRRGRGVWVSGLLAGPSPQGSLLGLESHPDHDVGRLDLGLTVASSLTGGWGWARQGTGFPCSKSAF